MNIEEQSNDRLLHAKNLLKKFQSKNQRNNDFDPLINSTNRLEINMDINNSYILNNSSSSSPLLLQNFSKSSSETKTLNEENSMNGPGNSSASEHLLPINQLEGNHVRCYSVPENMRIDETELNGSRSLLVQKEQELTIALSKLNLLHKSYSELYTAYNQLIEKNDAKDGRETPVHVNNQIQQLQIALTHSLEEKTALQNELRDVKSKMEELKNSEIFKIKEKEMPQKNDFSDFSDLRLASIQQEKEELLITVNNLSQQIENERTLSSNLEAKLFMAQQDKMDTQAHLKSIYQEKVQLELKFEKCKQELAMRDIYLQQLSKQFNFEHLTENSNFGGKNDEKDDKISQEEFSSIKLELENSRKHVQTLQEQLQINSLQANSRLQKVEEELEKSKARFNEVCSLKDFLEESLRIAHETIEKNDLKNKNTLNEAVETEQNSTEIDSLKTQISTLIKEKVELINLNKEELNKLNEEKNLQIEELKNELNEAMERICEFERNKILKENIEQDASVLSIQLQNEKATVSRAISQNIELKKQLEELQTRLVEVINSLAEKENERLTLNCTISKLKKDFDELKNEKEESQKIERGVQTEEEIKENDKNDQNFINESLNNEQNCEKIEEISDKISDPKIDKSIKLKNNEPIEPFFEENEHLKFKKVEEENNNKKEEENEENILKNTNNLQERLDQLYKENEQFRLNNSKLQYWLTALETENESIGEYVALYRFQRGNVQKRIAENEALLNEFKQQNYYLMNQISHVCSLINSFLINNESTEENSNNEDCQQKIDNLKTVVQTLEKTLLSSEHNKTFSQSLCSSSNTNNGLQIRCTGCAGCRGEMSTL